MKLAVERIIVVVPLLYHKWKSENNGGGTLFKFLFISNNFTLLKKLRMKITGFKAKFVRSNEMRKSMYNYISIHIGLYKYIINTFTPRTLMY